MGGLALCVDRAHNGDLYLQLLSGRFITEHGLVSHDPFPTIAQGRSWLNQQWLAELAFYRATGAVGLTGVTVLYAILIAAPLALLLWCCRRAEATLLVGAAALYFPGLLAVIHPRAAGFTVLAFSLLVALILAASRADGGRRRWWLAGIVVLFAPWANLHAGFVAGLLLIALVTVGLAIDRLRGLPGALAARGIALLGLAGVAAAATATLATPLGGAIWSYVTSFTNPAISLGSKEWGSALHSGPAMAYLAVAAGFGAWLWWRAPSPRPAMPLLVTAGFVAFAALSLRNVIFVAPALALQIAWSSPQRVAQPSRNRPAQPSRLAIALLGSTAAAAALVWAVVLGPPPDEGHLRSPVVAYALRHPPRTGRIATYAGVGSYILWRSPRTPVVIDGWLEHFSTQELRGNYGILRGWHGDPTPYAKQLHVSAAIAHLPVAIRALEAHGFVAKFATGEDTYLVRRGNGRPARELPPAAAERGT